MIPWDPNEHRLLIAGVGGALAAVLLKMMPIMAMALGGLGPAGGGGGNGGTVQGLGTAGSPSGGVLSVQGVAGGTVVPIVGAVANDTSAIGNGAEVLPAVARANATATTAGRAEKLQISTLGGAFSEGIGTGAAPSGGVLSVVAAPVATASTPSSCTSVTTTQILIAANTARRGFKYCAKSTNAKVAHVARDTTATSAQSEVLQGACWGEDNPSYRGPFSFVSDDGSTATTICVEEW